MKPNDGLDPRERRQRIVVILPLHHGAPDFPLRRTAPGAEVNRPRSNDASGLVQPSRWYEHAALHFALLAALTVCYLAISWRRWADPVVDFGRELYIPWRLSEGAVLYRDVEDFYGPFSQYLNAILFRIFGPGMMVLVWANLAVFAGIISTTYLLVRRAWGSGAAFVGSAVFIAIFGFSRFVYVGNFNYATPYAHETTHGVLVLVLLAAVLTAWLRRSTFVLNAALGLLGGLTLVLKAEIALSATLLIAAAVVLRTWRGVGWPVRECAVAAGMAMLPTLLFFAYFSRHFSVAEAWGAAGRAWMNVLFTRRYISDPAQFNYSGMDAPWVHLGEHLYMTGGVGLLLAVIVGAARLFEWRGGITIARVAAVSVLALLALGACLCPDSRWIHTGQCLLGLVLVCLTCQIFLLIRARRTGKISEPARETRILLAVLGASLMARMILAGRIYQFGYYQAALAAVVVVAFLIGELPGWVAATRPGRAFVVVGFLAVLIPGVLVLTAKSYVTNRQLVLPIGNGLDRFYIFPVSTPVASIAGLLEKVPPGRTLLVLPEGLMLNYLTRMPSPAPHFFYYSAVTENGEEARLVERLAARPPDFIVTLPRVLKEYGIEKYGTRSGAGGDIFTWMNGRYELHAWVRGGYTGPDPAPGVVGYSDQYVQVYGRKRAAPPTAPPAR